jgi:hypothetical protein
MNLLSCSIRSAVVCLTLAFNPLLHAADAGYQPELFKSTKLVYADTFDGTLNTDVWEVRQNSTWKIENGVLTGSPATKENQDKKIAE